MEEEAAGEQASGLVQEVSRQIEEARGWEGTGMVGTGGGGIRAGKRAGEQARR